MNLDRGSLPASRPGQRDGEDLIVDDSGGDVGSLSNGWCLSFTTMIVERTRHGRARRSSRGPKRMALCRLETRVL